MQVEWWEYHEVWGHSNYTMQTNLFELFQSVVVGAQNLQAQMLTPSLTSEPPGETFTNYFCLWWCLLHYMILSSDYHLSATTASLYCPAVANFLLQNNDHQTQWQIQDFPEEVDQEGARFPSAPLDPSMKVIFCTIYARKISENQNKSIWSTHTRLMSKNSGDG